MFSRFSELLGTCVRVCKLGIRSNMLAYYPRRVVHVVKSIDALKIYIPRFQSDLYIRLSYLHKKSNPKLI